MNKPKFSGIINGVKTTMVKRSPEILTGIGIAGMITTAVLAVRATPKALDLIRDKEDELEVDKLTIGETIKTTWKCYIPAVTTCVASTVCLIGASSVHTKRNAALAAAYKLSETALIEYKDAVIETIGEKEKEIRDKVAEKKLEKNPVSKNEVIITGKGSVLCYETHGGRYFESDMEEVKRIENVLNKQMLRDDYVSLNDFYDEVGLSHTDIGNELGWSINDGMIEIYFSSKVADDGRPCLVVDYSNPPKYNFNKFA